jgi:hypothetical protein
MSFSQSTAIELCINANDLSIRLYTLGDKFGALIVRGHGECEEAITCIPPMFSRKAIVEKVEGRLVIAGKVGREYLDMDETIMNEEWIKRVISALDADSNVLTHTYSPART